MDDRGRLAQPLKPKKLSAASPRMRSGWQRQARRWLGPVVGREPPRGLGVAAAVLLVLASAGYGIAKGGHAPAIAGQVQSLCDAVANAAGFRIESVAIDGNKQLTRGQILGLAGIGGHSSLPFLDVATARAQLKANPWIAEATVQKLYPGDLRIKIEERKPFAIWQNDGRLVVIADDGTVLDHYVADRFKALPMVVGHAAEKKAREFLARIAHYPDLHVQVSVLVAERRWNLHLRNGIEVLLPESGVTGAVDLLTKLAREKKLMSRDIVLIDLRSPDRVTVRLTDGAAQIREKERADALKASDDRKPKRKGGDA